MSKIKNEGSIAKGVVVGAALLAGVAAAIALKDEKNRNKVKKSLSDIRDKGMKLKTKAENWAKELPTKDEIAEELSEKNPVKKAARAIAS